MADQAPDLSKQQTGNAADSPWTSAPSTPPPVATSSPPPPPQPASQPANWWDQLQPTPAEEPKISTQPLPPEEEPIVKPVVEPSPPTVPEPSSPAPAFSVPPPPASSPPPTVPAETGRGLPNVLGLLIKLLVGLAVIIVLIILITKTLSFVQQKRTPGITTLTYWGLWEDKNVIDTVVADFTRDHPDIKIDYQKRDIKQYRETLKSRLVSGQGPDIFRFHNSWLPMFKDELLPLPKEVVGGNPQNDFYPVIGRDIASNGAYYGLPLEIDTLLLFINKNLFDQAKANPPKTWNQLRTIAPQLTIKDASGKIQTAGVALGTFDNIIHASDIISLMFAQNGADPKKIKDHPTNAQDALIFYTSFAKGENKVWDETLDPSLLAFTKGNLAMFFGYSWDIFTIKAMNPELNFEVAAVPQLDENKKVALASYWVEGVSKKSKNQKAAFQFLAYLAKKETLQKLYSEEAKSRLFGEPYARTDLADSLKDNPYVSIVVSQAKDATSTSFASDTFDNGLNSELNRYLGDAVRSLLGNTSPDTVMETLIQGFDAVSGKYGAF